MDPYTLHLRDVGPGDVALAGGKAAGLTALVRAGFPVPSAFVVTTAAYTDFLAASGLDGGDPQRLHERIPHAPVPAEIAASIVTAYSGLGAAAVAVRSSGTAEDLAGASFAGQYDTYLSVAGEQAVLAAVRDCWASLWTPRAVAYRRERRWDDSGLALAVVVQEMVDAEWAGVLFTADPVTGRRDRIVIEAVPGLGEALVSGETAGHRRVVNKRTGRPATADAPLPDGLVEELAALGARVEEAFGCPQDLEWTYAEGRCSLVQARPLTALPDEPGQPGQPGQPNEDVAGATRRRRRRRGRTRRRGPNFALATEHLPYPPYPMDCSLSVRPTVRAILDALRSAGFSAPAVEDVVVEIGDGVVQISPPHVRPTPRALVRVPAVLPRLVRTLRTRPADWRARYDATVTPLIDHADATDLTALADEDLLDGVESLCRAQGALTPARFGCVVPRALLADRALAAALRLATGPERAERLHSDLMSAIPSVTWDANRELDRLAATIDTVPELRRLYGEEDPAAIPERLRGIASGRALLADVDGYLRRYGCRQISVPLVGFPPLRETPEVVHGLLKSLSRARRDGRGADSGDEARVARARRDLSSGGVRARLFAPIALALLRTARAGVGFREDSHFLLFMAVAAAARRLLLELGGRLVERGELEQATDVFYLELDDLRGERPEPARDIAGRRKAAREAVLDRYTVVPAELLGSGSTARTLRGAPASRGRVVGRVRVIRDESQFARLADGEILVCPYTNPAWTPLFSLASAVVVDAGGTASHAAIVAREYGIPAVMGTGDGTRLLWDGQRVLVDGDSGTVVPLGGQASPHRLPLASLARDHAET